jgi:hypothetical protein
MKKTNHRSLTLKQQTIRPLTDRSLAAAGGGTEDIPICPPYTFTKPKLFPPNPC